MRQDWKAVGSVGTIGLEVVLSILLGFLLGRWLDSKLGTGPVLSILWFFFGVAAGGRAIWRAWKDMQAEAAREEREQGNPAPLFDAPKREAEQAEGDARWAQRSNEQPDEPEDGEPGRPAKGRDEP